MKNKTTGKKEKILEAGLEVFASKGFDTTTVDDIVLKSECGKGTFYKYFKSKEDLFECLFDDFTNKLINKVNADCKYSMNPSEFIYNYVNSVVELYEKDRRVALIKFAKAKMLVEGKDNDKVVSEKESLFFNDYLHNYILLQTEHGTIKKDINPAALQICIIGAIQSILFAIFKYNKPFSKNELKDIVNIIMNGAAPVC